MEFESENVNYVEDQVFEPFYPSVIVPIEYAARQGKPTLGESSFTSGEQNPFDVVISSAAPKNDWEEVMNSASQLTYVTLSSHPTRPDEYIVHQVPLLEEFEEQQQQQQEVNESPVNEANESEVPQLPPVSEMPHTSEPMNHRKVHHFLGRRRARAGTVPKKYANAALTPEQMDQKRERANEQERVRMHNLNDAMKALRKVLPTKHPLARRKSKINTLRLAIEYIKELADELNRT